MISVERVKRIIQCYGGRKQAWPGPERLDVVQLLLDSKSLTDIQQQALIVDDFMGIAAQQTEDVLDQQCANRILANLPEQQRKIHPIISRLLLYRDAFREKIVPAMPVVLVVALVISVLGISNSVLPNKKSDNNRYLALSEYMAVYVEDQYISEEEDSLENDEQLEILAFIEPQIMSDYY